MNAPPKILGSKKSKRRAELVAAAEQILLEEGFSACTNRNLANRAGIKFQLIYYYFHSMEDLLLEVFEQVAERSVARLRRDLESETPVRALWDHHSDPTSGSGVIAEFSAMAKSNERIREALFAHVHEMRTIETEGLERYFAKHRLDPGVSPADLTILLSAIARSVRTDADFGLYPPHNGIKELADTWIGKLEAAAGKADADRA